jgi:hypothetical protein
VLIRFTRPFDAPLSGGGSRRIEAGTVLDLAAEKAAPLIAAGIAARAAAPAPPLPGEIWPPEDPAALPRIGPAGELVIPLTAPRRFRWWQGGQEPSETLREIYEERAAIMEYDGGLPRPEAERQAAEITGYKPPDKERRTADEDKR